MMTSEQNSQIPAQTMTHTGGDGKQIRICDMADLRLLFTARSLRGSYKGAPYAMEAARRGLVGVGANVAEINAAISKAQGRR